MYVPGSSSSKGFSAITFWILCLISVSKGSMWWSGIHLVGWIIGTALGLTLTLIGSPLNFPVLSSKRFGN